jgi:endoglucanase
MDDWFREFRGYNADGTVNLPFKVWNYHAYANDGGSSQTGNITRGMAPEPAGLHLGFLEVKAFIDEHWPGVKIILGEHGYDKSRYSTQAALRPMDIKRDAAGNIITDAYGNREPIAGDDNSVRQLVDAQWTSRTQEILGALGIFRMQYYMLNNASDPASPYSRYSDCGMFEPDGSPRVVARYNRQRLELQGEYVPQSSSFVEGASVWSVEKTEPSTGKQLTCFWVPKEEAATSTFRFTVTAPSTVVRLSEDGDTPHYQVYQPGTYDVLATETTAYLMRNTIIQAA